MKANIKIYFILIFTILIFTIFILSKSQELDRENCLNSNKYNDISKCNNNDGSQDVFTFSVIRHGARNSKKYSDFNEKLFYGSSNNHLTIEGINQLKLLSIYFKERYSCQCSNNNIVFFSSPKIRAITSAESFISNFCDENSY